MEEEAGEGRQDAAGCKACGCGCETVEEHGETPTGPCPVFGRDASDGARVRTVHECPVLFHVACPEGIIGCFLCVSSLWCRVHGLGADRPPMVLLLAAALFGRPCVLAGWPRLPHGTLGCVPWRMEQLLRFSADGVRRFLCPSPVSSLLLHVFLTARWGIFFLALCSLPSLLP